MFLSVFFFNFLLLNLQYFIILSAASPHLKLPKTITCNVLSSELLTDLSTVPYYLNNTEESTKSGRRELGDREHNSDIAQTSNLSDSQCGNSPLVLAGLHACGDLSVNMLR